MSHPNSSSEYPGNIVSLDMARNSTSTNKEELCNSDNHKPSIRITNHSTNIGDNPFLSQYKWSINNELPAVGANFINHPQVFDFEYSTLFRHIATIGHLSAPDQVNYCTPEVQLIFTEDCADWVKITRNQ